MVLQVSKRWLGAAGWQHAPGSVPSPRESEEAASIGNLRSADTRKRQRIATHNARLGDKKKASDSRGTSRIERVTPPNQAIPQPGEFCRHHWDILEAC